MTSTALVAGSSRSAQRCRSPPSAYRRYAARQRHPALLPQRAKRDALLLPEVQRVFDETLRVYGADKVWLLTFDETALVSATEPARFAREAAALGARIAAGEEISAVTRERYASLDASALLTRWRGTHEGLVARLSALDPTARLAWYGPPMSARSFATARLMETWAHGQDIWDVMRRRRPGSARLKHIAHLGVGTFGWTFVNRKLPVPDVTPFVALSAPDGNTWTWGDPASEHRLSGSAEDFCLVVTQRRHVQDTALRCSPGPVSAWLAIAQCFAGPPADGPAPGVRRIDYP